MIRVLILTIGSRGDVEPYIALAKGLITKGHKVRLATLSKFTELVREADIDFAPLDAGILQILDTQEGQEVLSTGLVRNGAKIIRRIRPILYPILDNAWSAAQDADLIIFQPLALAGNSIAEKLHIPGVLALPAPLLSPTRAFASPYLTPPPHLGLVEQDQPPYSDWDNTFHSAPTD